MEFLNTNWQHLGPRVYKPDDFVGRHAMVLVGSRLVGGKERYLLQNWWKTKPYIEVDADYLKNVDSTIHFLTVPQMEMGDYPTTFESLVECDGGIDASENFMPEAL